MTSVSIGRTPRSGPRLLTAARRAVLEHRVRWVVAATISWNVVEAVVAISAGRVASSAALVGFGLDSLVEVLSAAAVAWQFAGPDPHRRERAALRLIAVSFFGLAVFVWAARWSRSPCRASQRERGMQVGKDSEIGDVALTRGGEALADMSRLLGATGGRPGVLGGFETARALS